MLTYDLYLTVFSFCHSNVCVIVFVFTEIQSGLSLDLLIVEIKIIITAYLMSQIKKLIGD